MIVPTIDNATRKNKLRWRCRRGTLELELLLLRYINTHYDSLSTDEVDLLQEFIELEHGRLDDWLLNGKKLYEMNKFHYLVQAVLNTEPIETK